MHRCGTGCFSQKDAFWWWMCGKNPSEIVGWWWNYADFWGPCKRAMTIPCFVDFDGQLCQICFDRLHVRSILIQIQLENGMQCNSYQFRLCLGSIFFCCCHPPFPSQAEKRRAEQEVARLRRPVFGSKCSRVDTQTWFWLVVVLKHVKTVFGILKWLRTWQQWMFRYGGLKWWFWPFEYLSYFSRAQPPVDINVYNLRFCKFTWNLCLKTDRQWFTWGGLPSVIWFWHRFPRVKRMRIEATACPIAWLTSW